MVTNCIISRLSGLDEKKAKKSKPYYEESELLVELNEYNSHAGELAELAFEQESPE